MNVQEIIKEHLIKNGYDGLCNRWEPCGCGLDDLIVCGEPCHECEPAYKGPCTTGEFDFMMYVSKDDVRRAEEELAEANADAYGLEA